MVKKKNMCLTQLLDAHCLIMVETELCRALALQEFDTPALYKEKPNDKNSNDKNETKQALK